MRCVNCGATVAEDTIFCPHCGHRAKIRAGVAPFKSATPGLEIYPRLEPEQEEQARPSGCKWVLVTGLFVLVFLIIILGLGALGVYHGLQDQNRSNMQAAQEHYEKGLAQMDHGNYELAVAEFEMATRLNPDLEEAAKKLEEARALVKAKPTPTANSYKDLADRLYREGRAFYDEHEWEKAIAKLEELHALDAKYQPQDAKTLLFWSYYNSGLLLVSENRMEEAIHRFDQALELQPDNPDVLGQRHLASLYVTGLRYWEADWAKAVESFTALYQIESNYRDVRQRLHDAHVAYGDFLSKKGSWCPARDQYAAALQITVTQEVSGRRDAAAKQCSSGALSITVEISPTTPAATPAPKGTFVGRITRYEDISFMTKDWGAVEGYVRNAAGAPIPGTPVKIQAFDWSAVTITGGDGKFAFGYLMNPEVTFTVTLVDLPCKPVDVLNKLARRAWLEFTETR